MSELEALKAKVEGQEARIEALEAAIGVVVQLLEPKAPSLLEQSKKLTDRVMQRARAGGEA